MQGQFLAQACNFSLNVFLDGHGFFLIFLQFPAPLVAAIDSLLQNYIREVTEFSTPEQCRKNEVEAKRFGISKLLVSNVPSLSR
jgi:hypothetical protein